MSLVITMFVREGIVMASDSRVTLNSQTIQPNQTTIQQLAVSQSDSVNKIFATSNGIGIATYGAADISGIPISGYIESFIIDKLEPHISSVDIDSVPQMLLEYFTTLPQGIPKSFFHVAGYKQLGEQQVQRVYVVNLQLNEIKLVNVPEVHNEYGATWGGESDILARIVNQVFTQAGDRFQQIASYPIPFQFFTLQDAIDFASFAISTTINAMRFMARAKTVGGPVDILVIKPTSVEWVKRKNLGL